MFGSLANHLMIQHVLCETLGGIGHTSPDSHRTKPPTSFTKNMHIQHVVIGYQHEPRCQDSVGIEGVAHAKVLVEDLGGHKPYSLCLGSSNIIQYKGGYNDWNLLGGGGRRSWQGYLGG
ncbi:hypothetical protein BDV26DRAFT_136668 [Aspergillus bertholletiae]|uniref:Uncharacterized protein n=1 Tax=Aspergillus bertholletiae TaxID=1226010 RepID=A0A5N7APM0_9EURO|nr:hypothetical protein BDV26DRAFT_136668 [Aspergillus bertholletiae]